MKVISLWQPWATWCMIPWKTIETRGHNMFRSLAGQRIAIHAARKTDPDAWSTAEPYLTAAQWNEAQGMVYPHGYVLGTVTVAYAIWGHPRDSKAALCPVDITRYCLYLAEPHRFETPIPARGFQGIWEWDGAGSFQDHWEHPMNPLFQMKENARD